MNNTTVNILGTEYKVIFNEELEDADGLCDSSVKEMKVCKTLFGKPRKGQKKDLHKFAMKVLRHEVIHAFRNESGLTECASSEVEQWVDWIAHQHPKMNKVFEELKCN